MPIIAYYYHESHIYISILSSDLTLLALLQIRTELSQSFSKCHFFMHSVLLCAPLFLKFLAR